MPRRKKPTKTAVRKKQQVPDALSPQSESGAALCQTAVRKKQHAPEALGPKSESAAALCQTVIEFQSDANEGPADPPATPPPTPNGDLSSGSASPESIVSFAKEEEPAAVVSLVLGEAGPRQAVPKPKGRTAKLKPSSPMKRDRTEEMGKPPSPMKKEKADNDNMCSMKTEEKASFLKNNAEEKATLKEQSKDSRTSRTLDDYFGCSPRSVEAEQKDRGRMRRSRSAAAPRKNGAGLEQFSLDRHFPIQRRSSRRDEKMLKEMSEREVQRRVLADIEEGMKVVDFELKGRGVVATRRFDRDEFVVEYAGRLVTDAEAKRLNAKYAEDPAVGSYMFWIMHKGKKLCVDATAESGRFGRLINHSRTAGNLRPKVVEYNGQPRLLLFSTRQIFPGEELLYDYGDRDKQTLEEFPWLKS